MTESKKDIIARLQELESKLSETVTAHAQTTQEINSLVPDYEAIKKAYEEIQAQFDRAERTLREKRNSVQELIKAERYLKQDIEDSKRDLRRILDAEQVDAEYLAQVEAFREKALASTWRKENRDDGYGAYKHQIEGAIHLAVTKSAMLGDKRGLGKTLTALATLDLVEAKRVIIISPGDLVNNIVNEIKFWAPHRKPFSLHEMGPGQRDFMLPIIKAQSEFVVLLAYSAWRRDKRLIQDLIDLEADALILDEAHHGKNWDTVTARGLREIRFGTNYCPGCSKLGDRVNPDLIERYDYGNVHAKCQRCGFDGSIAEFSTIQHVIPMTGSAIMNRPQELFPNMHLVDPVSFPLESAFLRDFCTLDMDTQRWRWKYGGQEKAVKKMGPRYYARSREDTDVVIPPFQVITHDIDFADLQENYPEQYKAYVQVRDYAQLILDPDSDVVMTMMNKLAVLTRLRQILVWPAGVQLKTWDAELKEEIIIGTLDVHESIKLDKAIEEIEESFEAGDGTVLFSMFKPGLYVMRDRLNKKGIRTAIYDGSTPRHVKNEIEIDFDIKRAPDKPRWDVLLCNYRSAGEGLNFTRVSEEILLDRYWNPAGEDQASGRINRIGTRRDSVVHKLMVRPSIDVWMEEIIQQKDEVINDFETSAATLRRAFDAIIAGDM